MRLHCIPPLFFFFFFFFHDPAPTEIYTLSLHDALPICERQAPEPPETIAGTLAYMAPEQTGRMNRSIDARLDRKSTPLNSSHVSISYAVFCLKKKKKKQKTKKTTKDI